MKTVLNLVLVTSIFIMSGTMYAFEDTISHNGEFAEKASKILQKSGLALEKVMEDPENSIPPSLVGMSEGVVIFPNAFKLAIGTAGGQVGRGIAMIRHENGTWSNPFFVTLGEGSIGLQIGAQRSDIILLFKNRDDILALDEAGIMLGSGMAVAAGPESKDLSAATDIHFEAEIYSYQYSKGLFAGISLNGGVLANSHGYNDSFYWLDDASSYDVFNSVATPYNDEVYDFIETLNMCEDQL